MTGQLNPYRTPPEVPDSATQVTVDARIEPDDENSLARRVLSIAIFAVTGALIALLIVLPAIGGADTPSMAFTVLASGVAVGGLVGTRFP